jgi:hypothetical protein
MLGNLINALMQPSSGSQGGADILSQVVGGLMGGGGQGGAPVGQLLSGLEQVIGGKPGSGQTMNQGSTADAGSPIMGLLGPIANAVAAKAGISPQVATAVAGVAMHYLLSSHPAAGVSAPLNLPSVTHQMVSGSVSPQTLQSSGMVTAVMQATGLSKDDAAKSLDATFDHLSGHVRLAGKQKAKKED